MKIKKLTQIEQIELHSFSLFTCGLLIEKFVRLNIHYSKISGTNAVRNKWAASKSKTDVTSCSKRTTFGIKWEFSFSTTSLQYIRIQPATNKGKVKYFEYLFNKKLIDLWLQRKPAKSTFDQRKSKQKSFEYTRFTVRNICLFLVPIYLLIFYSVTFSRRTFWKSKRSWSPWLAPFVRSEVKKVIFFVVFNYIWKVACFKPYLTILAILYWIQSCMGEQIRNSKGFSQAFAGNPVEGTSIPDQEHLVFQESLVNY